MTQRWGRCKFPGADVKGEKDVYLLSCLLEKKYQTYEFTDLMNLLNLLFRERLRKKKGGVI